MPLAVVDGQVDSEWQKDVLDADQEGDVDSGTVNLGHDARIARRAGRVDGIHGEDVTLVIAVGKLDPKCQCQAGRAESEWNNQRSAGPSRLVAKEEVVVRLDDFATIFARQIERTTAIEIVDQVDTSGRERASSWNAFHDILFAMTARETIRTDALVAGPVVDTSGAILADSGGAGVEFVLTSDSDVIRVTSAVQSGTKVATLAVIHARVADTTIRGRFATFAIRTRRASAEKVAQQIDTIGVVQTRLRLAETNVLLAPLASPACWASTLEIVDKFSADSAIETRRDGRAFVDFVLAQSSSESWATLAVILVDLIQASVGSNRIARVVQALVDVNFALDA